MTNVDDDAEPLVLITTFIVPSAMESAFLAWWRMVKPFMAMQPGFVSARLHRSLDDSERYRFLNIAEWRGDGASKEALAKMWSAAPTLALPGFEWRPVLYEVVEAV
jgi:antibiotic biosynthesis monooxygenase (ABM) superfamily enzyme